MAEVNDPNLLSQLNGPGGEVTDPELLKQLNAPGTNWADSVKEGGLGLARGAASFVGDMGEALAGPFNPSNQSAKAMREAPEPTAADIQKYGSRADYYRSKIQPSYGERMIHGAGIEADPKTTAGRYVGSAFEAAGNPASYIGPGGAPAKIAAALWTGLGSQAGKELMPQHPVAGQILGGLAGGFGIGAIDSTTNNIMRARAIPTTAELRQAADTAYGGARALNPQYDPRAVEALQNDIRSTLIRQGHRPDLSSGTFSRIDELTNPYRGPGRPQLPQANPNFSDIEGVRQTLNQVRQEVHPATARPTADSRAANVAIDKIDDFLADHTNAIPQHQGIARQAADLAEEGRQNWASMSRSQAIERALETGELRAGSTGSGANIDNVLRQQVRQILTNPKRIQGFSADERAMMNDIVMGNPVRNSLRLAGKMAATGLVSAAGIEYLAHVMGLGPAGHLLLPAAGYAFKKSGDVMTRNRIGRLGQSIRLDSPLGTTRAVPARSSAAPFAARSLLSGTTANPYAQ